MLFCYTNINDGLNSFIDDYYLSIFHPSFFKTCCIEQNKSQAPAAFMMTNI